MNIDAEGRALIDYGLSHGRGVARDIYEINRDNNVVTKAAKLGLSRFEGDHSSLKNKTFEDISLRNIAKTVFQKSTLFLN